MTTVHRGAYALAQRKRRKLIEGGVEPWRVTSTPNAELDRLLPVQLTLVPDVEPVVEDPRWAETPDEAESTRYFRERMRVGEGVVIPLRSVGLGGGEWGGGAA